MRIVSAGFSSAICTPLAMSILASKLRLCPINLQRHSGLTSRHPFGGGAAV